MNGIKKIVRPVVRPVTRPVVRPVVEPPVKPVKEDETTKKLIIKGKIMYINNLRSFLK